MLDTIAGLCLGAFLLSVAVHGNSQQLLQMASRDRAFAKWAVAVGILYYLYSIPELHEVAGLLIALAFLGFGIVAMNNQTFSSQIKSFWDSF